MTNCKSCGNFQNRLNKGGLCDACKNGQRQSTGTGDNMNAYYDANMLTSGMVHQNPRPGYGTSRMLAPQGVAPGSMMTDFHQQQQQQQQHQHQHSLIDI